MMRYQRVSPDCVPLTSTGKKLNGVSLHQTTPQSTANGNSTDNDPIASSSSSFEPSKAFRFRSPSRIPDHNTDSPSTNNNHFDNNNNVHHHVRQHQHELSPSDMLLQWGRRKRPRASRTEIRVLTDDSASSSSVQVRQQQQQQQQPLKSQRRHVGPTATTAASMPPPPPPPPPMSATIPSSSNGRARKEASSSGSLHNRNLEDRSGAAMNGSSPLRHSGGGSNRVASRSATGKRSPPPEKNEKKSSSSARVAVHEKPNGSSATQAVRPNPFDLALLHHHEQEDNNNNNNACSAPKEPIAEVLEWPKIQIPLTRKEKEEDFFALRGTKLPQRPKKRTKNVERALSYIFPGLYLGEVTRSRYEVREKKCVKKQKRRGLKGMESVESDSE